MKIKDTIYLTKNGDLTTSTKQGAFLFMRGGREVSPGDLKKYPALEKYIEKPEAAEKEKGDAANTSE
jgi:hypothetical protein